VALIRSLRVALLFGLLAVAATAKEMNETVFLFQNRKVAIAVPDGLGFNRSTDERGFITVRVADQKAKVSLQVTFLHDPDEHFSTPRNRREFMNETFNRFVGGSVEKAMQFEELEPRVGAGTYCIFTDADLVGKTKLPAGEFLNCTVGVKSWPGVYAVFEIFSQDPKSKEYLAVMKMLRESVHELPVSPTL
jgi:hypothetical protein